jgi:hypothetical protein
MHEIIVNLHMHTFYSDGTGRHADIAQAALRAGLDAVIITDHNIWVNGPEGYYPNDGRQALLLVGEEIHNQARVPQKNHLIVLGTNRELATQAQDPQRLLDMVRQSGGLSFIAHPVDPAAPAVYQDDLSWVDWNLSGFTGIELWNGFSEFKSLLKSKLHAIFYAYAPRLIPHEPFPAALEKWDDLISQGRRVVAIGGSDAHALHLRLGPLRRTVFPYEYHFGTINTHLLLSSPLSGDAKEDRRLVLDALAKGHAFIGNDLPASTRGFRFSAQGKGRTAQMGEELPAFGGVTLQVRLPRTGTCRLIKDGHVIQNWQDRETYVHITTQPGAYRVEAYTKYWGRKRGWIFSNPIYLTK